MANVGTAPLSPIDSAPKRGKLSVLFWAVIIQLALIALTIIVVVVAPSFDRDPAFVAQKTIYLPQRELQHQAAVSEFQQAASAPVTPDKLTTQSLLPDIVPALPQLPSDNFSPFESATPSPNAASLLGSSGLMGALSGLSAGSSEVSFLGVRDEATRLVIAFDISTSVVNDMKAAGMEITEVRDATIELINGLNANTLFGLVQFARNYDVFQSYLVPATVENKQAAIDWLRNNFQTDGTAGRGWSRGTHEFNGIQSVMKEAFQFEPDVIFLVSNGRFYRSIPTNRFGEQVPYRELLSDVDAMQRQLPQKTRIHFIGFGVRPDIRSDVRRLARGNQGSYREY